jgi:hypothetical protein
MAEPSNTPFTPSSDPTAIPSLNNATGEEWDPVELDIAVRAWQDVLQEELCADAFRYNGYSPSHLGLSVDANGSNWWRRLNTDHMGGYAGAAFAALYERTGWVSLKCAGGAEIKVPAAHKCLSFAMEYPQVLAYVYWGWTLTDDQLAAYKGIMGWVLGLNYDPAEKTPYWVLAGLAGSGKEQPLDATVYKESGPCRLGDLVVGDKIYGRNGQLTTVTGIYPQGIKQVYEVVFRDNTRVRCGAEHLWYVESKKRNRPDRVLTTQQLLDRGLKNGSGWSYRVPFCEPVQYPKRDLPIHPYLLGCLLGNGNFTRATQTISLVVGTQDAADILDRIMTCLPEGMMLRGRQHDTACVQMNVCMNLPRGYKVKNPVREGLRTLGLLGKGSRTKFIPEIYLYSSIEDRLELLRGLMDTDGSCRNNKTHYSTFSPYLRKDIATLVQSLGGMVIDNARPGSDSVNVRTHFNPFYVSSKAQQWHPTDKNPPRRSIKAIVATGEYVEQQCISVDAPDHLYLTDNYTVTHNTSLVQFVVFVLQITGIVAHNRIIGLAPTHKAVRVLGSKLDCPVATVHSSSGLKIERLDDGELGHKLGDEGNLRNYDLAIVDECSMVGEDLVAALEQNRGECKLLYVGDPAQFNPVKELRRSTTFDKGPIVLLKSITRQAAGNPLILASRKLRLLLRDKVRPTEDHLKEWLPAGCFADKRDMGALFMQLGGVGADGLLTVDARVIAYRNTQVVAHNTKLHGLLHPGVETPYVKGTPVMMQATYDAVFAATGEKAKDNWRNAGAGALELRNSYEYVVAEDPVLGVHPLFNEPCWVVTLAAEVGVRSISSHQQVYVPLDYDVYEARVAALFDMVPDYSTCRSYEQQKRRKKLVSDAWEYKDAWCLMRHSYCLTAHKSQGSTFDHALVDLMDLDRIKSSSEMTKALYVALTRPKHSVTFLL